MRFWVLHSAGRRVIENAQVLLGLSDADVAYSRDVLRRYGNLSSATVLFVLDAVLRSGRPRPGDIGAHDGARARLRGRGRDPPLLTGPCSRRRPARSAHRAAGPARRAPRRAEPEPRRHRPAEPARRHADASCAHVAPFFARREAGQPLRVLDVGTGRRRHPAGPRAMGAPARAPACGSWPWSSTPRSCATRPAPRRDVPRCGSSRATRRPAHPPGLGRRRALLAHAPSPSRGGRGHAAPAAGRAGAPGLRRERLPAGASSRGPPCGSPRTRSPGTA